MSLIRLSFVARRLRRWSDAGARTRSPSRGRHRRDDADRRLLLETTQPVSIPPACLPACLPRSPFMHEDAGHSNAVCPWRRLSTGRHIAARRHPSSFRTTSSNDKYEECTRMGSRLDRTNRTGRSASSGPPSIGRPFYGSSVDVCGLCMHLAVGMCVPSTE